MAAGSGNSSTSIADKYMKTMSCFFNCPRLFTSFTSKKALHETETIEMSPTSILDSKPSFAFKNPFSPTSCRTNVGEHKKRFWDNKLDCKGLVDALEDDTHLSKSPMVVLGSHLRIQAQSSSSHSGGVSVTEMELSEDYTRVICHGPNPTTTHIFGSCIIQTSSCFDVAQRPASAVKTVISYPSHSFLSFCFQCNKDIWKGTDIYMYRGERAFCSTECRYKGMLLEGEDIEGI